jgi:hypothetical protein
MARLLWLHSAASPQERAAARERATRHAEFFIRAVFPASRGFRPSPRDES